jgi:hypothetical protein
MNIENHCGNTGCICTHTLGCEKGWIYVKHLDEKYVEYEGVSPCPICDPDRYEIFLTSKSRAELFERLRARGTHTKRKAYDEGENSKTRTL